MATIETSSGDVHVMTTGKCELVVTDGESYYDVGVRVSIGERTVCGGVSIGYDGHAIGRHRSGVSPNILVLIEDEVLDDEVRAVLDEIEATAGSKVEDMS